VVLVEGTRAEGARTLADLEETPEQEGVDLEAHLACGTPRDTPVTLITPRDTTGPDQGRDSTRHASGSWTGSATLNG